MISHQKHHIAEGLIAKHIKLLFFLQCIINLLLKICHSLRIPLINRICVFAL